MEAIKCPNCGAPVAGTAPRTTCSYCGAALAAPAPQAGAAPQRGGPAGGLLDVVIEGVHGGNLGSLVEPIHLATGLAPPMIHQLLSEPLAVVRAVTPAVADALARSLAGRGVTTRLLPARPAPPHGGPPGGPPRGPRGPGFGGRGPGGPPRGPRGPGRW